MKFKVKHLDHINMTVKNLEESAAWYESVFGFEIVENGKDNGDPWSILRSGEALLCIYQKPNRSHVEKDFQIAEGLHTINHFSFRIEDRRAWESKISTLNLDLYYGGEIKYPHSSSWYVKDPTGYMIEVVLWTHDRIAF